MVPLQEDATLSLRLSPHLVAKKNKQVSKMTRQAGQRRQQQRTTEAVLPQWTEPASAASPLACTQSICTKREGQWPEGSGEWATADPAAESSLTLHFLDLRAPSHRTAIRPVNPKETLPSGPSQEEPLQLEESGFSLFSPTLCLSPQSQQPKLPFQPESKVQGFPEATECGGPNQV